MSGVVPVENHGCMVDERSAKVALSTTARDRSTYFKYSYLSYLLTYFDNLCVILLKCAAGRAVLYATHIGMPQMSLNIAHTAVP